ncbi:MAG: TRAP transporter small permease [Betaproteobacteria bacterium]|nr:MAG: TRAP transporter small permease [Betaproteobacteria bacterium]
MTGLYAFNVLVRSLAPSYASEIAWIDEAARYAMIWVVFLATGISLEVGRHVSVDLLRGRLARAQERVLFALIDVVGLAFCAAASVVALRLAWFVRESGQLNPTLGVPTYVLYLAPAYGLASMALRFLLRLLGLRDARRRPVAPAWLEGGGT